MFSLGYMHVRHGALLLPRAIPHGLASCMPLTFRTNCATCVVYRRCFGTSTWWRPQPQDTTQAMQLVRLSAAAPLLSEADVASAAITELQAGDLVEAVGDIEDSNFREWLLVRSPGEEAIDSMSDKPLAYQTGWLHQPELDSAEHQLGDKVVVQVDTSSAHPVLGLLRTMLSWWGREMPPWIKATVSELHAGKIGGLVKNGRFLVQRPCGAMPERMAARPEAIMHPSSHKKQAALAGSVGLVLSVFIGTAAHGYAWLHGDAVQSGRMGYPNLIGWMTLVTCLLTPLVTLPCYNFANTLASTAGVVLFINLVFYCDLFGQ